MDEHELRMAEEEKFRFIQDKLEEIIRKPRNLAELKTLIANMTPTKIKAWIAKQIDEEIDRLKSSRDNLTTRETTILTYKEEVK